MKYIELMKVSWTIYGLYAALLCPTIFKRNSKNISRNTIICVLLYEIITLFILSYF